MTAMLGQPALDVDKANDDDMTLWSVTTVIGALDKPALLYWAAEQAAIAAIDSQATWQAMLNDAGRAETVKYLRDARFRRPKLTLGADQLGTVVHAVCETYALTRQKPGRDYIAEQVRTHAAPSVDMDTEIAVVATMLDQFDRWLQRFTPSYQATEVTVYHPGWGYAGTLDAALTIDGVRFITDYKTRRDALDSRGKPQTPYPEQTGLQLAAYRFATHAAVFRPRRFEKYRRRYYCLNPDEQAMAQPVPEVDTGLIILITPESCEAFPIRCDEEVHLAFGYTLEAFRWLNETSRLVLGDPLTKAG
jgi:hypothetical protein